MSRATVRLLYKTKLSMCKRMGYQYGNWNSDRVFENNNLHRRNKSLTVTTNIFRQRHTSSRLRTHKLLKFKRLQTTTGFVFVHPFPFFDDFKAMIERRQKPTPVPYKIKQ